MFFKKNNHGSWGIIELTLYFVVNETEKWFWGQQRQPLQDL